MGARSTEFGLSEMLRVHGEFTTETISCRRPWDGARSGVWSHKHEVLREARTGEGALQEQTLGPVGPWRVGTPPGLI